MVNLEYRSAEKELLDADDIPFEEVKQCMEELNSINTLLGGHAITIDGIKCFTSSDKQTISVCELGCGGGDNLQAVHKWGKGSKREFTFTGIDMKQACIDFAAFKYPNLKAAWITNDYSKVDFGAKKPDVIFSSLFCHHFSEDGLIKMLTWMKQNSNKGFFINDLHRNNLAFFLIKWLTAIFSKSKMVKHDAPLSVARSFKKADWIDLLKKAGINNYTIQWKWAFRYLIICKK